MTDTAVQPTLDELQVPIEQVHQHPDNVRSDLGDLTELVESIRSVGILQPLLLCPHPELDGHFVALAGNRRLAAGEEAGLAAVPAVIRETPDDVTFVEMQLAENTHRSGLDPIDEAQALLRIKGSGKYRSVKEIAARVHRSEVWVAERLKLLTLPESTWPQVRTGEVTLGDALDVAKIAAGPEAKEVLLRHAANGNRRAVQTAVEEQRETERRRELEKEYGPLRPRSGLYQFTEDAPWGVVRIGDAPGELNVPVAMHRGCDGHAAFDRPAGSKSSPDAYCSTPLEHAADFPGTVEWPHYPSKAQPLRAITPRPSRIVHAAVCENHRTLEFPWGTVEVCTDPTIHTNPKRKGYLGPDELIARYDEARSAGTAPAEPAAPRWEVDEATRALLVERMTEALAPVPAEIVAVFAVDWCAPDEMLTRLIDESLTSALRAIAADPSSYDPRLRHQDDRPAPEVVAWALQACVDAGNPPPNLDEIRTRLDVITKGELDQDEELEGGEG